MIVEAVPRCVVSRSCRRGQQLSHSSRTAPAARAQTHSNTHALREPEPTLQSPVPSTPAQANSRWWRLPAPLPPKAHRHARHRA